MSSLQSIYSRWQRQTRFEQISWIGLLLFFSFLIWDLSFIHGLLPGPYHLALLFHRFALPGFWCLVLAIIPASVVFPLTTLAGINRRWLKFWGLMLLVIVTIAAMVPILFTFGPIGLLKLLALVIVFDIWWILIIVNRFPQRIQWKSVVTFSLLLLLCVSLIPVGGFSFSSADSFQVKDWAKSYHAGYMMSMDIQGQLVLVECGATGVFCKQIYRYCDNLGPNSWQQASLTWADDRLSLTLPPNNKSASGIDSGQSPLYQRSKDKVLIDTPSFDSETLRDVNCRFSF